MLAVIAVVIRYVLNVDATVREWGFHTLVKVALLTTTAAVAWPQLMFLGKSSYGQLTIAGLAIAAFFFMIRPKAFASLLPIIVGAILLLIAVTFARNFFGTPPKQK